MKKENPSLRFFAGCAIILLSLVCYASPGFAQTSVGIPPIIPDKIAPSFGLEFGYGQHTEKGTYMCPCGSVFTGGNGNGILGSLFFEMPIGRTFAIGLKAGLDYKNSTSTSGPESEPVIIEPANSSQYDTLSMSTKQTAVLKMTLLRFAPYFQFQLFHTALFVQSGPGISYVASSNLTQTRNLLSNSVTLDNGTTINNLTFSNGTSTESIQNGSLANVQSLLFSWIFSAGYGFSLGNIVISPIVTYDLPLSNIQSNSNLRISSIYGSVGVKFKL